MKAQDRARKHALRLIRHKELTLDAASLLLGCSRDYLSHTLNSSHGMRVHTAILRLHDSGLFKVARDVLGWARVEERRAKARASSNRRIAQANAEKRKPYGIPDLNKLMAPPP